MDSTAMKMISQDRAATYKSRGKPGSSNRIVRAHQASIDRKASRMDNLTKRRRIPLSPIADNNHRVEEGEGKIEDGTTNGEGKATSSVDPRREKLLKWREQQMLKKKVQEARKPQKKSFVVKQIDHTHAPFLSSDKFAKVAATLVKPAEFQEKPVKRVTRASTRLTTSTAQDSGKSVNKCNTKRPRPTTSQNNATNKPTKAKVMEKKETVKDSKKSTARQPKSSAAKIDPKQRAQVKTRSQLKNEKLQETKIKSSKETGSEAEEPKEQLNDEAVKTPSFPQLKVIKSTVSVGRGSTEGAQRGTSNMEEQSFAPIDFHFSAPSGVGSFLNKSKSFKFQPLSPASAEKFMFPSFSSFFSSEEPANQSPLVQQCCGAKQEAGSNNSVADAVMEAIAQTCSEDNVILGSQQNSQLSTEDTRMVEDMKTDQDAPQIPDQNEAKLPITVEDMKTDQVAVHIPDQNEAKLLAITGEDMKTDQVAVQIPDQNEAKLPITGEDMKTDQVAVQIPDQNEAKLPITGEDMKTDQVAVQIQDQNEANLPITVEDMKIEQVAVQILDQNEAKPDEMEAMEETNDHDVTHFRNLIKSETEKLNKACENWEKINAEEPELSEEVNGQIRTVIGQAQLLIAQRFHQFSGLIALSQDKTAEKRATASDLQGFWEMIYFQVEDVNVKFEDLSKLQQNGWKEEKKVVTNGRKKPKSKKPKMGGESKENAKPSGTRNRIQEMRARMKAQKSKLENANDCMNGNAFVTILTPMTKRTKFGNSEEVVLTPVRRSVRKTPSKHDVHLNCPAIVTTPRKITQNSPVLKLTPDTTESTAQERGTPGLNDAQITQLNEDEGRKDITEDSDVSLERKTACEDKPKSVKGKRSSRKMNSRKSSGQVTFQSADKLQISSSSSLAHALSGLVVQASGAEKRSPKTPVNRRLSRKCRSRVPTPYFSGRIAERRVSDEKTDAMETHEEPAQQTADSTSESDGSRQEKPLRRSKRKTPAKLRKRASSIDEKSGFLMYLTTSDEEIPAVNPQQIDFQGEVRRETTNSDTDNDTSTCCEPLASGLRLKGTPINILRHINDTETPSPNSRQITPMPKTTLYISPPGANPMPLLPLTPVVNDASALLTPATRLAGLTLSGTPLNLIDKRRDSVFFAPASESLKSAQENLMCFSPAVATDASLTYKCV